MTFCIGIKVREGVVAIADTRISAGSQMQMARKITVIEDGFDQLILMTSGLRSLRDKVLTYFEKTLEERKVGFDNLYQTVNVLAGQVRRVAAEDKAMLKDAGLTFDLHCLIGGKLSADRDHKLYLLYPEANWVEVTQATPYCILGANAYGKPLLDRVLNYESPLQIALQAGFLAFDATQSSATDVGYPMEAVVLSPGEPIQTRLFGQEHLAAVAEEWKHGLRRLVERVDTDWMEPLLGKSPAANLSSILPHDA